MAEEEPEVEALLEELRHTVESRRRQGLYPAGLEEDLAGHFRRIVRQRVKPDLSRLDAAMQRLRGVPGLSSERIQLDSDVPGGGAMHRTLARLAGRQTQGILEQVEELAAALRSVADELSWAVRQAGTHVHIDLIGQIDALQERLSALERQPLDGPSPGAALAELSRRLERLESKEAGRQFRPPYSAADFEAAFRGSEDELKVRYRDLAGRLAGCSPVLDIGCGRGEFMELLAEIGVESSGVELDPELAAAGADRGLDITGGDGLAHLAELPDRSLGGLALVQVVEHLSPNQVSELTSLAADKLRPGGRAVIETVNPQSLYVFARAFYLDPTHQNPVHPAYLTFLFRRAGFQGLEIDWRTEPSADESLRPVGTADVDENFSRINQILFGPQDYALIATR